MKEPSQYVLFQVGLVYTHSSNMRCALRGSRVSTRPRRGFVLVKIIKAKTALVL